MVRSATAWTAAVCLVSFVGCASSRSGTTHATVAPQTAQTMPRGNPQVDTERLLQIGDTLRLQGRHNQAAEVYSWVLQRDPNNLIARQRLAMLPATPAYVPASPEPTRQAARPMPPPAPTSRRLPSTVSPAPGVIEDVPAFPGPKPAPRSPSGAPGVFDSAMTRYQSSSRLPTTVVQGATSSEPQATHTIQIIPASKGGLRKIQKLNVADDDPVRSTDPFRAPVPATGDPSAANDTSGVRPTAAIAKSTLPPALKELGAFVERPGQHVAAITAQLHHESADVRALAAFLLGRAGDEARGSLPALEAQLTSERNGPTRIRVAEAIVRIAPQHADALRTLLAGLSASNRAVRWEAVCVSDSIKGGPQRAVALAKVIDRLRDVEIRIQVMAALKLGEAKSEQTVAAAALEKVLAAADSTDELKKSATIALAALRSGER